MDARACASFMVSWNVSDSKQANKHARRCRLYASPIHTVQGHQEVSQLPR